MVNTIKMVTCADENEFFQNATEMMMLIVHFEVINNNVSTSMKVGAESIFKICFMRLEVQYENFGHKSHSYVSYLILSNHLKLFDINHTIQICSMNLD